MGDRGAGPSVAESWRTVRLRHRWPEGTPVQMTKAGLMGEPRRRHFQMLRSFTWADLFTFGNASCGMVSLFLCLYYLTEGQRDYLWAIILILPLALVLDGLDGYVARRWGQQSSLGAELDSLADIISFGVAPAVLGFSLGLRGLWDVVILTYYVGCGISRLARYNVTHAALADATGKVQYYEGIPIPSNLFIVMLLGIALALGQIDEALWFGAYTLTGGVLHPLTLIYALSGTAMVSSTLRVPKL
jgi:CDP-diacylglycerol--serine O-phosphatidyltransferase